MFEAVARSSAYEPHIPCRWMTIDDEIVIRCLLVLADASLQEWRVSHSWEAKRYIIASQSEALLAYHSFTCGRIKNGSTRIVCDLEAACLVPRNAIHEASAMIGPHGQMLFVKP